MLAEDGLAEGCLFPSFMKLSRFPWRRKDGLRLSKLSLYKSEDCAVILTASDNYLGEVMPCIPRIVRRSHGFHGVNWGRELRLFRIWMRAVEANGAGRRPLHDRYSLDGRDEVFEGPRSKWGRLPIWTGTGRHENS